MPTYGNKWRTYAKQWDGMTLKQAQLASIKSTAKRLVAAKARYQAVEKKTGVPWYWIAATHEREASQSWNAQLAQGDPLNRVSTHVPRGQGPYTGKDAWERAAIIAIETDGLHKVKDWRLEKLLYYWELYNGWGYYGHGVPSPYVWGATSVQQRGKYVSDGNWSSTAIDTQLGTAAMLKAMMDLDKTIKPVREDSKIVPDAMPPADLSLTGVKWIQDTLNKILVPSPELVVDGSYGKATRAAVREYQRQRKLTVDGEVGDETTAAMDADLEKLKAPVVVAAKKSWWSRLFGRA